MAALQSLRKTTLYRAPHRAEMENSGGRCGWVWLPVEDQRFVIISVSLLWVYLVAPPT